MLKTCICCSGKREQDCCASLLSQQRIAKTPVQLMRSRYSAYALGGHGDYLLATWLPSMAEGLSSNELSVRSVDWVRLEIVSKSQQGDNAQVEFKAFYLNKDGQEEVLHENSTFSRVSGRWYYIDGEIA